MVDTLEDRLLFAKIFNAAKAKKRDASLEQEILAKDDPDAACLYAIYVIKGAWKEAEPIISKAGVRNYSKGYLTRFPDKDGVVTIRFRKGNKDTTSISDPVHFDPNYRDAWNRNHTKLIVKSNAQIANAYLRLTKERLPSLEKNTKIEGMWMAKRVMPYVKLVYELTGDIADFEDGMVAVEIINAIKENDFSKKPIPSEQKETIIKELEQRMTLYSFTGQQEEPVKTGRRRSRGRKENTAMGAIKSYFETRVEAMNELFKILNEHDDNMTISELKKVLRNERAA